ncbi:hypothetical protein [Pseudomonas sp. NCCP-436]|uniref:hypothetical protein n=1 Tax=Pseudomonas sp. NCCP-436 TaxID=2842481 RepID=UPI001C7E62B6|nr:hypothetical protein [Pseudomonas sp. NCCP-436]GIZ12613.1 hypothetical protein NCCP436_20290 [Pseudomonas sp. NCCP-436]
MPYRHLLALALPFSIVLSAGAAEWSAQARSEFVQQCVAGAPTGYQEAKLKAYCDCAADKVSAEFSESELQAMTRQSPMDPAMQQRLQKASGSCATKLSS